MPQILGYAVVDQSGKIWHASGLQSVVKVSPGLWNVTFNFSVAGACEVASVADATPGVNPPIKAYGGAGAFNMVTVDTSGVDATFQLLVVQ